MTIAECKANIPLNVKVKIDRTNLILNANVVGRKNDFASVMFENNGCLVTKEFSWAAISRCMTIGTCLIV